MDHTDSSWSLARTGRLQLSDPSEFEQAVAPWDVLCSPLNAGPFGYSMRFVSTPYVTFYRETYGTTVRIQGASPPGALAFAIPVAPGPDSTLWNRPLPDRSFPATLAGAVDAVMTAGHDQIIVLVALSFLQRVITPELVLELEKAAHRRRLLATRDGIRDFRLWLLNQIALCNRSPALLQDPVFPHKLELEVVDRLVAAVHFSDTIEPLSSTATRRRALDRALSFLQGASNPTTVTVPEICKVIGTSQRTLEYAFQETFDMAPRKFLAQRRLHATRRDLLAAEPGDNASVASIAHRHGFHELGRFAGKYKKLFGELPSATLRNKPATQTHRSTPLPEPLAAFGKYVSPVESPAP